MGSSLQVLIEKLADYKQQNYAISMSLPSNADMKIQESIRQIDDRIDFLRQRAHDGLEKIQVIYVPFIEMFLF